jgi:hypothetical protein
VQNLKEAFEIVRNVIEAHKEFRNRKHDHDLLLLVPLKAKDVSRYTLVPNDVTYYLSIRFSRLYSSKVNKVSQCKVSSLGQHVSLS